MEDFQITYFKSRSLLQLKKYTGEMQYDYPIH